MPYHRIGDLLSLSLAAQLKVVLIGVGSLGSMAAANLAYPWGQIILIDPDKLEVKNVERHVLGKDEIGNPKVEGMRRWLLNHINDATPDNIIAYACDVRDVWSAIFDANILIVSIDDEGVKADINAFALEHGIPAIYGGVYEKGSGGEVIIIPDPTKACYRCAAHMLERDIFMGRTDGDYGIDISRRTQQVVAAVPALRANISAIADDMAMIALSILMEGGDVSSILMHAHGWMPIVKFPLRAKELSFVTGFVTKLALLGLLPTMRLVPTKGGYELEVRRGIMTLTLKQWDNCPLHSSSVNPDDI